VTAAEHAQVEKLIDMVQSVEWVRQASGHKYACPWCHSISERDGGPGHQDDCPWMTMIERGVIDALLAAPPEPCCGPCTTCEAYWPIGMNPHMAECAIVRVRCVSLGGGCRAWTPKEGA